MSFALSVDLRDRIVEAVNGGMSRRAAALRFRVSAASAVRWVRLARDVGSVVPKALGGDRRSGRIEAQADFILGLYEAEPDITLKEILAKLVEERDERFGIATLSRFFKRRGITFKKRPRTRASKIVRTS